MGDNSFFSHRPQNMRCLDEAAGPEDCFATPKLNAPGLCVSARLYHAPMSVYRLPRPLSLALLVDLYS
jgi:hypothetical protein